MAEFRQAARTADIPVGSMKACRQGHLKFVIAHTADGFFAVANECSHDSAPISDGELSGNEVVCARHGARFDLSSGAVTAPPALVPIDTLELKIDGDNILVKIED